MKISVLARLKERYLPKAGIQMSSIEKSSGYITTNTQQSNKKMKGSSSDDLTLQQAYLSLNG